MWVGFGQSKPNLSVLVSVRDKWMAVFPQSERSLTLTTAFTSLATLVTLISHVVTAGCLVYCKNLQNTTPGEKYAKCDHISGSMQHQKYWNWPRSAYTCSLQFNSLSLWQKWKVSTTHPPPCFGSCQQNYFYVYMLDMISWGAMMSFTHQQSIKVQTMHCFGKTSSPNWSNEQKPRAGQLSITNNSMTLNRLTNPLQTQIYLDSRAQRYQDAVDLLIAKKRVVSKWGCFSCRHSLQAGPSASTQLRNTLILLLNACCY